MEQPDERNGSRFVDTPWPLLASIRSGAAAERQAALDRLCHIYWRPIYSFIRWHNHTREEAEDLTQSFIVDLIRSDTFSRAEQHNGRFRSFILGALKHFLADEAKRVARVKRGRGLQPVELTESVAATLHVAPVTCDGDDESDRQWATVVLIQVWRRLEKQYIALRKADLLYLLRDHFFSVTAEGASCEELARKLGSHAGTLRCELTRLRSRFRSAVLSELRAAAQSDDIGEDLRRLRKALPYCS